MKQTRKIFFGTLGVITLLNLVIIIFFNPILLLTENQILYIFSDLGQVTAALFGLTFGVYSIVDSKEKKLGENDTTATEFSEEIRKDYFSSIIIITLLSIMTILFSILVLNFYIQYNNSILSFIMNQSSIFFVSLVVEIVFFVFYLNPKKIEMKGSEEKQRIEEEYSNNEKQDNKFMPFVTYYNLLEDLLNKIADRCISRPTLTLTDSISQSNKRLRILQCLDILMKYEIIDYKSYRKIDELRKYRNTLVHSLDNDKSVNIHIYNQLEQIYNEMNFIYENWNDKDKKEEGINNLRQYVKAIEFGDNELKIIKILRAKKDIKIREIAKETNMSMSTVARILNKLENYEAVERIEYFGKTSWIIKNDNINF